MLSPAQPQPSPSPSGKKMHHFLLRFSPKILKDREIMLFQNRKIKFLADQRYSENVFKMLPFFVRHHGANRASVAPRWSKDTR